MIRHIVMWKLKDEAAGRSKWENAEEARRQLEALSGRIPGLLRLEVGIDRSRTAASADLVLVSEFEDQAALDRYQQHPDHQQAADFIGRIRSERTVVDYEV